MAIDFPLKPITCTTHSIGWLVGPIVLRARCTLKRLCDLGLGKKTKKHLVYDMKREREKKKREIEMNR